MMVRQGRLKRCAVMALSIAGAFSACSSSGEESSGASDTPKVTAYEGPSLPPTPGDLPLDELGDAFETILCEALIRCQDYAYRSVADCKADREPGGLEDILDAVQEGRFVYDPALMGECRRVFEVNLCAVAGAFLFVPALPEVVALCLLGSSHGTQAEGAPCRNPLECRRELYCDNRDTCPGVCRARGGLGASCERDTECAPAQPIADFTLADAIEGGADFVRDVESKSAHCFDGTCRAASVPGDACPGTDSATGSGDCIGNLTFCDGTTCAARRAAGEPCAADGHCVPDHWCEPSASGGTCRPRSPEGGPCTQRSHCAGTLRCLDRDAEGTGRCGPRSSAGGSCEFGGDCAAGLACVDGACESLPGAGAPCLAGACATEATCVDGMCRALSYPGEACDDAEMPCAGVCQDGTCSHRGPLGATCSVADECASRACENDVCIDDELCAFQ
jgi:hypothetical protein